MNPYLEIIRPMNGFMAVFGTWIGMLVGGSPIYPDIFTLLGLLAVFFIQSGGMAVNDYCDIGIDRINRPGRPLPSGRISGKSALLYAAALFATGIIASYFINMIAFGVAALAAALLVLYAARLKKTMLLGHVIVSLLVALTFVFGGIVAGNHAPALLMAFMAFLSNNAREIYKSVEDALGDRQHKVNSIAVKAGVFRARFIAGVFVMAAIAFSFVPFFLGFFGQAYLFFVTLADIGFISAAISPSRYSAKLCKMSMLIALFAFLAAAVRL